MSAGQGCRLLAGSGRARSLSGDLGQAPEVAVYFEEERPEERAAELAHGGGALDAV
jgi:hypothetical protein